jgi:peptide/nickel transport system ATP-binding protein
MTDTAVLDAPVLDVRDLRVTIPTPAGDLQAVRGISFDVRRAETVCLVGESGCGKSLTSLALMGLLPKTAARSASRLSFGGRDLLKLSPAETNALRGDRMAMIFQEPMTALNPAWTLGEQLAEVHRRHKGSTKAQARDRAVDLLGKVGIASPADRLGQYPHQLSGGLRQRVMIAMALMCEPDLLIADEPTTALDVTIQAQILRLLADIQREMGVALLLITHDLGVVARIAHRVNVMYAGSIVESGRADELFADPRHPYTRGLLACLPTPGVTRPGSRLGTIPGVVPSLVGGLAGCAFRARCGDAAGPCGGDIPRRVVSRMLTTSNHDFVCIHEQGRSV